MGDRGRWIDGQDRRDRQALSASSIPGSKWSRCRNGETEVLPPRSKLSKPAMKESRTCSTKSSVTWMQTFLLTRTILNFLPESSRQDSYPGRGRNSFQRRRLQFGTDSFEGCKACFGSVPVVPEAMLGGNWRLYPAPRWGNRLDGGHDRPNDGLEDRVIPGEVVFSLPALGNRGTQCPLLFLLLRRERLLPWRASGLGTIPRCLPGHEATIYFRGPGLRSRLLLGFSSPDASASLPGTDGLPPQRTDGQAQGHSEVCCDLQIG